MVVFTHNGRNVKKYCIQKQPASGQNTNRRSLSFTTIPIADAYKILLTFTWIFIIFIVYKWPICKIMVFSKVFTDAMHKIMGLFLIKLFTACTS